MANKKKSFLNAAGVKENNNPAMVFISEANIEPTKDEQKSTNKVLKYPDEKKPPKGYKMNPLYVETKSKRLQLVMQPSLYEKIKATSSAEGLSVNEFCHRVLDEATSC